MSTATMAKKPKGKKPARNTQPVQVSRELYQMIATIAAHDNVKQGEVITPILLGPIRAQYARVQKEITENVGKNSQG